MSFRLLSPCPFFFSGKVVEGFGRGSKQLNIPTANIDDSVIAKLPMEITSGVFMGWAKVDDNEVNKMVMSIGWNPFFNNKKRSMEVHILREFAKDFYGSILSSVVVKKIREQENFCSIEALKAAIDQDILLAKEQLDSPDALTWKLYLEALSKNS